MVLHANTAVTYSGCGIPRRPEVKRATGRNCRGFVEGFSSGRFAALIAVLVSSGMMMMRGVRSSDVYEDGTIADNLPGSVSDSRGLPNSPFSVDANRLSDGVSSMCPISTTAPSFPRYRNATDGDGNELARQWANLTLASRLEQGVSPKGAGSFETTVARYEVLNGAYSAEKPFATFPVKAWERWNPSAFAIQQGETYTVEVPGEQYWTDGRVRSDAGGYAVHFDAIDDCWVAVGRCRAYLRGAVPRVAPPRARWMELVCGVGEFVTQMRDALAGEERYLPISDAEMQKTLFPVGRNLTFVASFTGELVCFANDAEGLYGSNRDALNVTVSRESWPPSGDIEAAYLDCVENAPVVRP